jgi:hypothetical protein
MFNDEESEGSMAATHEKAPHLCHSCFVIPSSLGISSFVIPRRLLRGTGDVIRSPCER